MAIKDITSAIKPSASTDVQSVHYLETETKDLDGVIADPRGFLSKNKLPLTAQSQVHTTMLRRPQTGAPARRVIIIIGLHFTSCDWLLIIIAL